MGLFLWGSKLGNECCRYVTRTMIQQGAPQHRERITSGSLENVQWWLQHTLTPYCVDTTSEASRISLKPQITAVWMFQGNSHTRSYIYSNRILTFSSCNSTALLGRRHPSTAGMKLLHRERRVNAHTCTQKDLNSVLYVSSERGGVSAAQTPLHKQTHSLYSFQLNTAGLMWGRIMLNGDE